MTNPDEKALREEIVKVGRLMYERGLVIGTDGNVSARLSPDLILVTASGLCKGMMEPDQLIVMDMEGRKVGGGNLRPTSETPMHLEAYRRRPDISAVVHAHPPITVALSIAGISLKECMLPEVIVSVGLIPTTQYATPSSAENKTAIEGLIAGHNGIVLQRHGALTVGSSPLEAFYRMETVEQMARVTFMLQLLGKGRPLPMAEVEKLLAYRWAAGATLPGEEEEFLAVCGGAD